jgi:hypothetical protein
MAFSSFIKTYVRTDGDDTNGAIFDPSVANAGTNYCDQPNAQLSLSDISVSTTSLTSVTGGFTAAMVGNAIRLSGGGATTGRYIITVFTSSTAVTIDRSAGSGTNTSGKVGGAFLSPATATASPDVSGVQSGYLFIRGNNGNPDYTLSAQWTPTSNTKGLNVIGYGPSRPYILRGGAPCLTPVGFNTFINCKFVGSGAGQPGVYFAGGSNSNAQHLFIDCSFDGSGIGILQDTTFGSARFFNCSASNCTNKGFQVRGGGSSFVFDHCVFANNGEEGAQQQASGGFPIFIFENCIFYKNGATTADLYFDQAYNNIDIKNCTFIGKSSSGCDGIKFNGGGDVAAIIRNCIFTGYLTSGKFAINFTLTNANKIDNLVQALCDYNIFFNNNATYLNGLVNGPNDSTSDPKLTNIGSSSLQPTDSTSSAWANAWPTTFLGMSTTANKQDRGAPQATPPIPGLSKTALYRGG